jgi:hypothetical protein
VILAMHNNVVPDKFKRFERNKENQETEQEKQCKIMTLPSFVSQCLAPHEKCTGQYRDTFNLFRLNCNCTCHHKRSIPTDTKGKAGGGRKVEC